MKRVKIDPLDFPYNKGESWWVVHPNTGTAEFRVPQGGITACLNEFLSFKPGTIYPIVNHDAHNGWITIASDSVICEMPEYVFARYFDAEAFVIGRFEIKQDQFEPWDYQRVIVGGPSDYPAQVTWTSDGTGKKPDDE